MTLSEMRNLMASHNLGLTKSLGQNFLHDGNQLRRIVRAAELDTPVPVIEVGPGLGPLTELLLAAGCPVTGIEVDHRLVAILRARFLESTALELVHGDALKVLREMPPEYWPGKKLVSNLPYSIASPLLVDLALRPTGPDLAIVTIQLEVAQRLVAKEDTAEYGLLTLLVGWRYDAELCFRIPGSCFFPPPDIESACLRLRRRPHPLVEGAAQQIFVPLIRQSFSQRRKMMWKLLRSIWPEQILREAFSAAKIPREARAETVSLEQFGTLAQQISSRV